MWNRRGSAGLSLKVDSHGSSCDYSISGSTLREAVTVCAARALKAYSVVLTKRSSPSLADVMVVGRGRD